MAIDALSDRPWLLLPGTLCTAAVFDPFLDALGVEQTNRRYVELDRSDINAYRDSFGQVTSEAIVCGFSLGAIVAAHAADKMNPHLLVLFGINPYADDPDKKEGRQALLRDVQRSGGAAALQLRQPDVRGPMPNQTHDLTFVMADQSAHLIEAQTQLALTRPGALSALADCNSPVLCLTGSHDESAPPEQGRAAAEGAPNGTFYELDGLGHFALMDDPKACADAVRFFHEELHGTT